MECQQGRHQPRLNHHRRVSAADLQAETRRGSPQLGGDPGRFQLTPRDPRDAEQAVVSAAALMPGSRNGNYGRRKRGWPVLASRHQSSPVASRRRHPTPVQSGRAGLARSTRSFLHTRTAASWSHGTPGQPLGAAAISASGAKSTLARTRTCEKTFRGLKGGFLAPGSS